MLKILILAYYRNYCTDLHQILHSDKDHRILFVGGPNRRITNPRWRTAAILKTEKWPYLRNGLINPHEIWQDDAYWPTEGDGKLKFLTFKTPRWRTAAILEKSKNGHISATAWPICMKFGKMTLNGHLKLKFEILKIQHGGRPSFWKRKKRPYLGNNLTDWREIWHGDLILALRTVLRVKNSNFYKSKMADGRYLEKSKTGYIS